MKLNRAEKVLVVILVSIGVLGVIQTWSYSPVNSKESVVVLPSQPVATLQPVESAKVLDKTINVITVEKEHLVTLIGEINGFNAAKTAAKLTALSNSKEPTILAINSPGGSVMDGALVINAMEASKTPVYTVCLQLCASMAAIIHQYGNKRMMQDRSILMFHDASGGSSGYLPHMISELSTITRYIERFNAHIAKRAKITTEQLDEMEHKQHWRDAEDSIQQNFTDKIVFLRIDDKDIEKAMLELYTGPSVPNDKKNAFELLEMHQ